MTNKAAFHLSELTDQPIPIVMRISLLIKTNLPHQSNPTVLCTTEMVFQQNFLEKAHFSAKMPGPVIVQPASSYFWKPLKLRSRKLHLPKSD